MRGGVGTCATRSLVQHISRKDARAARRVTRAAHLVVFKCPDCEYWHLGSAPRRLRSSLVDRAVITASPRRL